MENLISQLFNKENMSLKQFFSRSLGQWESHRNYMYANGKCTNSITIFDWQYDKKGFYVVHWDNQTLQSTGTMHIKIVSDFKLERSNGYFTNKPTESLVQVSSKDHLRTLTSYAGCTYDEEIHYIGSDRRIRRTIGKKDKTDDVLLIGTYVERKLS